MQKFIDGEAVRVVGWSERDYGNQRTDRAVDIEVIGRAKFQLTPKGARSLANMLWDEATKAEKK